MDKYRVTLDADERAALEQLINVGKGAARKLIHARVLLLADTSRGDERPDTAIVRALGISLRTVERVRQRLVTGEEKVSGTNGTGLRRKILHYNKLCQSGSRNA